MRSGTTLLLTLVILITVLLRLAENARQYENLNENSEARFRRHDSEDQRPTSGRRWTTSRNSPYQKIVSSYERAPEEGDEDKAKTRRKQWRSSAPSHDQIPSETSSGDAGGDGPEREDEESQKGQTVRRRSTTSQPRDVASHESQVENSTPGNKKRRRTTTVKTTTPAPQTMSDSLYKHFRPLDQNVPEDDIIPFLDFGRKLSAIAPTPSSVNSIENKSAVTRHRSRTHLDEREGNSSDEELLQEDMDVTVVKKAIERNSVPRAKLRVKEQGISDYYRKRAPAQVRTTENLIITSDTSTASSVPGSKTMLKKINRLHVHLQPPKNPELFALRSSEVELSNVPKSVEVIPDKKRQMLRSHFRSAALRDDNHQSPLTAESSVVKTVIKDLSAVSNPGAELSVNDSSLVGISANSTEGTTINVNKTKDSVPAATNPPLEDPKIVPNKKDETDKVLATAIVTSVSVQEPLLEKQQPLNKTIESKQNKNESTEAPVAEPEPIPLSLSENVNLTLPTPPIESSSSANNSHNYLLKNSSAGTTTTSVGTTKQPITTTERIATSLRPRDFYKPKPIPPGANIPHLPRRISLLNANGTSRAPPPQTTTTTVAYEIPTNPNFTTTSTHVDVSTSVTSTPADVSSLGTAIIALSDPPSTLQHTVTQRPADASPQPGGSVSTTGTEITSGKVVPITSTLQPTTAASPISNHRVDEHTASETASTKELPTTKNINSQTSSSTTKDEILVVESESVPPPSFPVEINTSSYTPVEETEDHGSFPIYFTTLMPPTVAVVDTRPDTEEAMVKEQKNASTPRPPKQGRIGADWVRVGTADKEVVLVEPEALGMGAYVLAALGVIPIVIGALLGARFILAHSRKKVLDESEYSSEYNRSPLSSNAPPLPTKLPRIPTHLSWNEPEKSAAPLATTALGPSAAAGGGGGGTPSAARWEFPREKLRLQTLLGQGNFGQVWKAEADDISGHEGLTRLVAVKTVKESANTREREDLLRELGIMQELGSHPNVVTLLGCCTEKEPIYLIMEYVMYGKLLSFLRDHRTRAHYYNFSDATDALTSRDLTVFGYCVARGLDYLANKSIIHRDLAARNVLVDHNKLCKIADFGMSRNVRDTGQIYEQRQSKGALPIRWMAPESLHFSLFTHKTDVWSFGILMWEIVTLGSTPYARWGAREVMRRVMDGYRLERPTHCRPELFRVIVQCWHSEPSKRPSFAELKAELAQLLSDSEHNGSYVDLDSYADEMRRDTLHRHH